MPYKWKPSASQKKAFAQRMQDPLSKAAYEKSKRDREDKRRATSKFDYSSAGGQYVPTKAQYEFAMNNMNLFKTAEEKASANDVIYGYNSNEKVHHDSIHVVNEKMRNSGMNEIKNILRKIIKEELQKINEVDIDHPELEEKAKQYAEIANKMKILEAELKDLEKQYEPLDNEFREILNTVGTTKDTFIRAGKLLIKIERAGSETPLYKYKESFTWLLERVNGKMKDLVNESMEATVGTRKVLSKISVVKSEGLIRENWITKAFSYLKTKFNKLFHLNTDINKDLDKLEKMI